MDKYFNEFLVAEQFGPIIASSPLNDEVDNYFSGKLPNRLLRYWREYGFAGFAQGLFWTVNPNDYQDLLDNWLAQTMLWERENFYVIARSAFGELYIRGDKSNSTTVIDPHLNTILPGDFENSPPTYEQQERGAGIFFEIKNKEYVDYDDQSNKGLFQRCLKKYGMLEQDEMYTFSTPLALGGSADINNIKKVKILEQLSILRDIDTPIILSSTAELFGFS